MQKGFSAPSILIVILILISLIVAGAYSSKTITPSPVPSETPSSPSPNPSPNFTTENILFSKPFTDSKGNKKQFIALKTSQESGRNRADAYIIDQNLNPNSAVKILQLSDSESADSGVLGYSVGMKQIAVSVSPGPGVKYLVIERWEADGRPIFIVDENGTLISDNVHGNALSPVKDKCQCSIRFKSWLNKDSFYVEIPTADGPIYQVLIDAKTGQTASGPIEI